MIYNHITYSLSNLDLQMVKSVPPGGNWKNIPKHIPSKRLEQIRRSGGRTTLYGRMEWNKPSYTVTTFFHRPGNGTYMHPSQHRVISAREAARLQSFPDNYFFEGTKGHLTKQIGNAVPPLLAYFLAREIKKHTNTENVLDLFCGAGGLSLGFHWSGYNMVAANDNYKQACQTYKKNHRKTILIEGDITEKGIKEKLLRSIKNKNIDVVIGGPPCQGFSYAGKRMIDDPRNFLFKEFIKLVKIIKPKAILMENVLGILTSNDGKTYRSIQESFKELGYFVKGKKIHAVEYGVPQKRKRVIMIGLLGKDPGICFPTKKVTGEENYLTVKDAISNLPPLTVNGGENMLDIKVKSESDYQRFLSGEIDTEDFIKTLKTSQQPLGLVD